MRDPTINRRVRIEVQGIVQGVEFRPFVYSLARRLDLTGFVRNHSRGVSIEIEGSPTALSQFVSSLRCDGPPLAQIDSIDVSAISTDSDHDFRIVASEPIDSASTPVSPDVAPCDECLRELSDPADRRSRYPFINCTNCGPRYTIVRDLPYDRALTTMSNFPMCAACETEYHDPADRRYHAQPNACSTCGPSLWFVGGETTKQQLAFTEPTGGRLYCFAGGPQLLCPNWSLQGMISWVSCSPTRRCMPCSLNVGRW